MKVVNRMSNYFNDIESDLYRLHSIIDVAVDSVPEMVAELKEKYRKAEAFDRLVDTAYWHLERIDPEGDDVLQFESFYKDIRDEIEKYESGESE